MSTKSGVPGDKKEKKIDVVSVNPSQTLSLTARVVPIMVAVLVSMAMSAYMRPTATATISSSQHLINCGNRGVLDTPVANSTMSFGEKLEWMRQNQFPQLKDQVYLDFTGAGQYQIQQVEQMICDLRTNLYGNAHSQSPSSLRTEQTLCDLRHKVLDFFNASSSQYTVIFTSGCTGALKLVGENFDFAANKSKYVYLSHNHNSVLGIREYALERGASYEVVTPSDVEAWIKTLDDKTSEENFSGMKFPLEWINRIHKASRKTKVVLDAAAYLPNSPLDLGTYPADFVTLSFYKIFGFPTEQTLTKRYFGGGTVSVACCRKHYANFHQCPHQDGTVAFLTIASLRHGLDIMTSLGMQNIQDHLESIRQYCYSRMQSTFHSNGRPVFNIFGNHDVNDVRHSQGPIITFTVVDSDGHVKGYNKIVETAAWYNVHIRAGTHCNPGAAFEALRIDESEFIDYTEQSLHSCGDNLDLWKMGEPTGTIRISFGYPTTKDDIDKFMDFVNKELVE